MEEHVLWFPERLRFNEVDPMFRFVLFAFVRIELELHAIDLTKAPASPASRAAPMRVHMLEAERCAALLMHHKRLMMRVKSDGKSKFVATAKHRWTPMGFVLQILKLARCPTCSSLPSRLLRWSLARPRARASYLAALPSTRAIETRSLPALARCYPCSFTFYVADPSAPFPIATCSKSLIPSAPFASRWGGCCPCVPALTPALLKESTCRSVGRARRSDVDRFLPSSQTNKALSDGWLRSPIQLRTARNKKDIPWHLTRRPLGHQRMDRPLRDEHDSPQKY